MEQNTNFTFIKPLNILFFIFLCTCFLDRAIQEGMFFDGITYACLSRNLAIGKGDFWNVYYRGTWRFSEHPPLMFGIEAIFFKVFGDHYLTEKIFSFTVWLTTIFTMNRLWNLRSSNTSQKATFGLAMICWGIVPTVLWSYPNNMLDSVIALFDLAAVYFIVRALMANSHARYLQLTIGGLAIVCATLTKGPVGFFPLIVPALYWFTHRTINLKHAILYSLLLTALVSLAYALLYSYPPARACFDSYLNEQLLKALAGQRDVVESPLGRFELVWMLLMNLSPSILLVILIFLLGVVLKVKPEDSARRGKDVLFYLLLGLCASLPIALSLKQHSFYLLPSLPYFAFAFALWIMPRYQAIIALVVLTFKAVRITNIALVIITISCVVYLSGKWGKVGHDEELISEIKALRQYIPEGEHIGACDTMNQDFGFAAYIERYYQWEINEHYWQTRYTVIDKTKCDTTIIPHLGVLGYSEIQANFGHYRAFTRPEPYSKPDLPESR